MRKIRIFFVMILLLVVFVATKSVYYSVSGELKSVKPYVIIDVGHGGVDSGKVGVNGEYEKDINLQMAKRLQKQMEKQGFKISLTRTDDQGLYEEDSPNKKAEDLRNRCAFINKEKPTLVVSIHQNSFSDSSVRGAQVFYFTHSSESEKIATCIQESLCKMDSENHRVAKANDTYYLLKKTEVPIVIAECGFLSNPEEAERLTTEEYQNQVAKAICEGIMSYLEK